MYRSIKSKLIINFLATTLVALFISGLSFVILDIHSVKQTLTQRLTVQCEVIASNSTVAIFFNDRETTHEILSALQSDQEIVSASVIKGDKIFASYQRQLPVNNDFEWLLNFFFEPTINLIQPVIYRDREIARLQIISDYPSLHENLKRQGLISAAVLLAAFVASLIIAGYLQYVFLKPIRQLLAITQKVAKYKDYQLKVEVNSQDELKTLADHFNIMLEQINKRDQTLEDEVHNRTKELIELNKTLDYRAHHDGLTQLFNRQLFNDDLQKAIDNAERNENQFAVLFMDLDHFKLINDTFGHDFGDQILCETANRLSRCVRKTDTLARMGGDEFTILVSDVRRTEDIIQFVDKILQIFQQPFFLQSKELFIKPSIGISCYPTDGRTAFTLQKNADTAMYSAKSDGGNRFHFFSEKMSEQVKKRITLETELHKALRNNEFIIYYQPLVDNNSNLIGFEALIRWNHPEKGMISPDDFITVAEETGQIIDIGRWVIEHVCLQLVRWRRLNYQPVPIHCNISPKQFNADLVHDITQQLKKFNIPADLLGCEITENIFVQDIEQSSQIIQDLHEAGIHLSIDDFGTGYSSLAYLIRFPINALKIDQSFVKDLMENQENASLVKGIINLAHSLNLSTIAEGIETYQHRQFLIEHGCDLLQGYYFAKPLPEEQATEWLQLNH